MKTINKNTLLKKGDKTFQPVEQDGIIYWVDKPLDEHGKIVPGSIVALTKPKFTGSPIISLDAYIDSLAESLYPNSNKLALHRHITPAIKKQSQRKKHWINGYKSNPNQYTQADIEKAFDAGCAYTIGSHKEFEQTHPNKEEYLKQANSIKVIEVDEQFNILSYE